MDLCELSFDAFAGILRRRDRQRFLRTLEFFPEEGKYHADGHRDCGVRLLPEETERLGGRCPKCGKLLTIGVLNRVHALADRERGARPDGAVPFTHLVPLEEIIAEALDKGGGTKAVTDLYEKMTAEIAPEFELLLDFPLEEMKGRAPEIVIEAIRRLRSGKVSIAPGYDGEFGTIKIFSPDERLGPTQTAFSI
jgi:PHP family Zn ribbon phosphoesterase